MGMNDMDRYYEMLQQIAKEKSLPLTNDIFIAISVGYARGFSEATNEALAIIHKALGKE